jgi:hypothetical protein
MTAVLQVLVLLLGEQLDAADWRTRERAQRALGPVAEVCPDLVEDLERHHPSLEVRRRCQFVMDHWYRTHAEALSRRTFPAGWKKLPKISSHSSWWDWCSDWRDDTCDYYMTKAGATYDEVTAVWSLSDRVAREATRLWLRDRLAARLPWRQQLDQLAAEEERLWARGFFGGLWP